MAAQLFQHGRRFGILCPRIHVVPKSDRGIGMVLTNFAINTGERVVASLAQEFLLRRFTHSRGIEVNAMSGAH